MIEIAYHAETVYVEYGTAELVSGAVYHWGDGAYGAESPLFPIVLRWEPGPMGVTVIGWGEDERPVVFAADPMDVNRDGSIDVDDLLTMLEELTR